MDGGGRVAPGAATENESRLQGWRWYDPMDGGGRVAPGAATENESGDRVEETESRR